VPAASAFTGPVVLGCDVKWNNKLNQVKNKDRRKYIACLVQVIKKEKKQLSGNVSCNIPYKIGRSSSEYPLDHFVEKRKDLRDWIWCLEHKFLAIGLFHNNE
jgi:hypothetical protein